MTRNKTFDCQALLAIVFSFAAILPLPVYANPAEAVNEALRVHVDGKRILGEADLQARKFTDSAEAMDVFQKNIVSIRRHSTARLSVSTINMQGHATVVTDHPATSYHSLSPSRLSVSTDGVVTAAPSDDTLYGGSGDVAVLIVFEQGDQHAWNKVFFNVVP